MGGKLQTLDADGNQLHSLGLSGEEPSWSPDGQWIVYVNGDNMNEVRPDGSGLHSILHVDSQKGWNFEPNWRR
jgi:Tol biopolymer transport system component